MKNIALLSLLTLIGINALAREGHESGLINRRQEIALQQQNPAPVVIEPSKVAEAPTMDAKRDLPCNMPCCS